MPAEKKRAFGLVARFEGPAELTHACAALHDAGYRKFDCHTPFPVHGLERAMGLPPSRLPFIVLGGGIAGLVGGLALQWWVHSVAYPLNFSGKPFFSLPAYIPVAFETTILLAAFGAFFGMWALNRLPEYFHPTMQHRSFERASDDAFFISVEAVDPNYDPAATRTLLEQLGGQEVEEVQP